MEDRIKQHIDAPHQLESLYQENHQAFKLAFDKVYADIKEFPAAAIWKERLHYKQPGIQWGKKGEFIFILCCIFFAGCIAKFSAYVSIPQDQYIARNIGFIIFPVQVFYFSWKQNQSLKYFILPAVIFCLAAVYTNTLSLNHSEDAMAQVNFHLPLFLWTLMGYSFMGGDFKNSEKRIKFLRFNGDWLIMTAIIQLAGILFIGIGVALFKLLGFDMEMIMTKYVLFWALPAVPILASYIVSNNANVVNKISPLIAKLFTPLVFLILVLFLLAVAVTGKYPYSDREFLLVFNGLLVGVMAIFLFSISEVVKNDQRSIFIKMLFGMALLTIITNGIALSAIAFRIKEYGFTPNRIAVLGADVLILGNLLLVTRQVFFYIRKQASLPDIERSIGFLIPIYSVWAAIVVVLFPFFF